MYLQADYLTDPKTYKQLAIRFNPKISYNQIIQESKVETIGGKYPYFYRNNNASGRKEFSISGMVSYLMDENEMFCKRTELGLAPALGKRD